MLDLDAHLKPMWLRNTCASFSWSFSSLFLLRYKNTAAIMLWNKMRMFFDIFRFPLIIFRRAIVVDLVLVVKAHCRLFCSFLPTSDSFFCLGWTLRPVRCVTCRSWVSNSWVTRAAGRRTSIRPVVLATSTASAGSVGENAVHSFLIYVLYIIVYIVHKGTAIFEKWKGLTLIPIQELQKTNQIKYYVTQILICFLQKMLTVYGLKTLFSQYLTIGI
jgi:hypothetical protein